MTGSDYRRAAVVGGGVIGTSWTALFLARGLGVTVSDPLPDVQQRVRTGLREIAPTLARLGLPVYDLTDDTGALTFEPDLARAVAAADVIQENGPERPDVKQELWATIEGAAPSRALFASSSSGIPASPMRQKMREPGRLIVGHPFNPPHLVPRTSYRLFESNPGIADLERRGHPRCGPPAPAEATIGNSCRCAHQRPLNA